MKVTRNVQFDYITVRVVFDKNTRFIMTVSRSGKKISCSPSFSSEEVKKVFNGWVALSKGKTAGETMIELEKLVLTARDAKHFVSLF